MVLTQDSLLEMTLYSQVLPKPIEKMSFLETTQKERSLEFAI
jgi:hypothetical protein